MAMQITPEWLRNKIKTEPDSDIEAGIPTAILNSIDAFLPPDVVSTHNECAEQTLQLRCAFGVLVRSLRRRDSLTIDALAEAADVLVEDIRSIECDPSEQARPRTVYKLAKVFEIEPTKLIKISGTAVLIDEELACETLKFAAKSAGVSSLTSEEQQILGAYVQYLNEA